MAKLEGQTIAASFDQVLIVDHADGISASLQAVESADTDGASSALKIATNKVEVIPGSNDANAFEVSQTDGTAILTINSTTPSVLVAGSGVKLYFSDAGGEYIAGDGTDLTITSGAKINLTATSDVHVANGTGVVIGHTAQVAMGEVTAETQILGTTETDASLAIGLWSTTDALSPSLKFVKGAHATIGTHTTTVADNEELGKIQAYGSDTADSDTLSSEIAFNIDDDGVGAGTLGGEILLKTSGKDGTLDTAVAIDSSQNINYQGNYIVNEQGRQDHVANTMPAPYYRFDGVNDDILIDHSDNMDVGNGDMSIHANIIVNSYAAYGRIASKNNQYSIAVDTAGKTAFSIPNVGTATVDTTVLIVGKVYDIVVTWDNATVTYYINGVLSSSTAYSDSANAGTNDKFEIGSGDEGVEKFFNGTINKVSVWNKVLSATEVKELYSGASVPFKYKGANQTEQVADGDMSSSTNWTEDPCWAVSGGKATFTRATAGGNQTLRQNDVVVATDDGKAYSLTYTIDSNSVDGGGLNLWGGGDFVPSATQVISSAVGTHTYILTNTGDDLGFYYDASGSSGTLVMDNVSVKRAGAVAEYDGSGVGASRWDDKSSNELHGTVTGATVENAPADADSGLTYEEGTWDCVVTGGTSGTVSPESDGADTCTYTKIGRVVSVQGALQMTAAGSDASGVLQHSLPFTATNMVDLAGRSYGSVALINSGVANTGHVVAHIPEGAAYFALYIISDTDSYVNFDDGDTDYGYFLGFQMTYISE